MDKITCARRFSEVWPPTPGMRTTTGSIFPQSCVMCKLQLQMTNCMSVAAGTHTGCTWPRSGPQDSDRTGSASLCATFYQWPYVLKVTVVVLLGRKWDDSSLFKEDLPTSNWCELPWGKCNWRLSTPETRGANFQVLSRLNTVVWDDVTEQLMSWSWEQCLRTVLLKCTKVCEELSHIVALFPRRLKLLLPPVSVQQRKRYLLKCFLKVPLTQYKVIGLIHEFIKVRQKPMILNECQYSS